MSQKTKTGGDDLKTSLAKLEDTLEMYLVDKAPFQMPESAKEFLVKYGPWLIVVMLVMAIPMVLFALGLGAIVAPFAILAGVGAGVGFGFAMIFTLAMMALEVIALPGLFNRKVSSWRLMFYASLLGGVQSLVTFNLGGLIIGTGLSLYILFQIKSYYK
ncbi:MAG: chromate transporter [bacterium]|nr:chromate transporter [bacterium]